MDKDRNLTFEIIEYGKMRKQIARWLLPLFKKEIDHLLRVQRDKCAGVANKVTREALLNATLQNKDYFNRTPIESNMFNQVNQTELINLNEYIGHGNN